MRKTAIALTLALLLSSSAAPAFAHAQLTGANPKGNSTIKALPKYVTLLFSDELITVSADTNQIQVTDAKGRRVDTGTTLVVGNKAQTALKAGLVPGVYKITYRVLSEDGHPVSASYKFTYAKKAKAK
jgi:methionine-rich copper-binding protein CopC